MFATRQTHCWCLLTLHDVYGASHERSRNDPPAAARVVAGFTANDAYMRDFEIFAPADCIASNTAADNEHALRQIATVLKGNVAVTTRLTFGGRRAHRAPASRSHVSDTAAR